MFTVCVPRIRINIMCVLSMREYTWMTPCARRSMCVCIYKLKQCIHGFLCRVHCCVQYAFLPMYVSMYIISSAYTILSCVVYYIMQYAFLFSLLIICTNHAHIQPWRICTDRLHRLSCFPCLWIFSFAEYEHSHIVCICILMCAYVYCQVLNMNVCSEHSHAYT